MEDGEERSGLDLEGSDVLSSFLGREGKDGGDGDDVYVEVSGRIDRLQWALMNERFSPEVLPFELELLTGLREVLDAQEEMIDVEEEEEEGAVESWVVAYLKKTELNRLNYLVRAYFRTRLLKIESRTRWILADGEVRSRLSVDELQYAEKYVSLLNGHFCASFLNMLPDRLRTVDDTDGEVDMVTQPDFDRFVFCRVEETVGRKVVADTADEDPMNLERGDLFCLRYRPVRDLVQSKAIRLL